MCYVDARMIASLRPRPFRIDQSVGSLDYVPLFMLGLTHGWIAVIRTRTSKKERNNKFVSGFPQQFSVTAAAVYSDATDPAGYKYTLGAAAAIRLGSRQPTNSEQQRRRGYCNARPLRSVMQYA